MEGGIPQIGALSVRPNLPDHLRGRPAGVPFPEVSGGGLKPRTGAGAKDTDRDTDERSPLDDRVSISSEAKALLASERAAAGTDAKGASDGNTPGAQEELTPEQARHVQQLSARDAEVRRHEQAHVAASGHLPTSGPSYTYETGPDGRRYAVGGEVNIALGEGRTPAETVRNAEAAQRAALAPGEPSAQDRRVASQAAVMEQGARAEVREERLAARDGAGSRRAVGDPRVGQPAGPSAGLSATGPRALDVTA